MANIILYADVFFPVHVLPMNKTEADTLGKAWRSYVPALMRTDLWNYT